ncbi:alpha/beta fold hydrolase [Euzebya rosea]|uniref:alpha/beta fold hydrolase n=1 Tax=Euzebya rosea TaxID=2052804 RepID=UPI000D3EE167|nr:alpha/beta fold hydrolase [Euzebya rosea]
MKLRTVTHQGWTLSYEEHGAGPRVTVLVHGLLLDAGVNRALARALARAGHRVILVDMLGHGRSDKPRRASAHRMDHYADAVITVLDHLEVDEAVVGGVSLGAGVGLMTGYRYPERVRAMVLEMPVLENATPFAAITFVPLLLAMHWGGPVARLATAAMARLPRTGNETVDSFLGAVSKHPDEIKAVLHGLLMGPMGPDENERQAMRTPALIIGHQSDPLHPHTDAARLARQLPNGTLLKARSPLELRMRPRRLTDEIIRFVDTAWAARPVGADGVTDVG